MSLRYIRHAYTELLLSARLLTFHYAVYSGLGHRGSLEDHRSCHWHASDSGSRVGSSFVLISSIS